MRKLDGEYVSQSDEVLSANAELLKLYTSVLPQMRRNWQRHSLVGLKVEALARVLYYADLYKQIVDVPGVVCEFGVQWGATLVELVNLRSIFEPFNRSRIVYGFDTFEGFPSVSDEDGGYSSVGDYASAENFECTLDSLLKLHEASAPLSHITKFQLIKGDASVTVDTWLENNPQAIIAMAIFDMDIYKPTRDVLSKITPRLTKGSLIVFDELNCREFPGETIAVQEVLGLNNVRLRRSPIQPYCAWMVWGE